MRYPYILLMNAIPQLKPAEIQDKKIDLKKKKLLIDQIAAKIILQSYLDQI